MMTGALVSIAALGLLSACGSDSKLTVPTSATTATATAITLPAGVTIPDSVTFPAGVSLPDSIPQQAIDLMISQMEAAGMKIDKACFTALLKDDSLRKLVAAGGTPTPEVIQKFISCIKQ
jgi:ABC-type glycerol-3-phosphate transport system substrate-binding protein